MSETFGFEHALWLIRCGHAVARLGWGSGLRRREHLKLRAARGSDPPQIEIHYPPRGRLPDGARLVWTPTGNDLLARDWFQVRQ